MVLMASSRSLRAASSARFLSRSDLALPNTSPEAPTSWSRHSQASDGDTPCSEATCDSVRSPLTTSNATAILNSGLYVLFVDLDTSPSQSAPHPYAAHCRGIRTNLQIVSRNRQPH